MPRRRTLDPHHQDDDVLMIAKDDDKPNIHSNGHTNGGGIVVIDNGDAAPSSTSKSKNLGYRLTKLLLAVFAFAGFYFYIDTKERNSMQILMGKTTTSTGQTKQGPVVLDDSLKKDKSSKQPKDDKKHAKEHDKKPKKEKSSDTKDKKKSDKDKKDSKTNDKKRDTKNAVVVNENVRKKSKDKFVLTQEEEFTPGIVWLMSFPNSGTSYTMTMVARSSGKAFATNYGDEVTALDDETSLSIYPRRPEGPFWAGKSGKLSTPRDLPDKYVLTKTHCGGRCQNCGPDQYVVKPAQFLKDCTTGHARVPPRRQLIDVQYPPERVHKAIHLIRNPMHNIIARYNLFHRHIGTYKNDTEWVAKHPKDKVGLHRYCKDLEKAYAKEDKAFYKTVPTQVPCFGEFYKWTEWHNLARESLLLVNHPVPVLTIRYEDYVSDFNATATKILDFLELPQVGALREFSSRSDYDDFFTKEEVSEIQKFIKRVAHNDTWAQIQHYFH